MILAFMEILPIPTTSIYGIERRGTTKNCINVFPSHTSRQTVSCAAMTTPTRSYEKSKQLWERAKNSLASGVSSQFRLYNQPHPMFYERAKGARIWDVDGNEYIDFTLSQG